MANIGIVGHEAAKFTDHGYQTAYAIIKTLLQPSDAVLVSGACHLGGIDLWAEVVADAIGRGKRIFPATDHVWSGPRGFKARNVEIATTADIVHCVVVDRYPPGFAGRRFEAQDGRPFCYHCGTFDHVKSGGCWTMKYAAEKLGKPWHRWIVPNDDPPIVTN